MSFHLHIGVLAFPFGTHAAPLLTLTRRLAASLPGVKFSFFNTESSNRSLFFGHGSVTSDNIQTYDVWDGKDKDSVFSGTHLEAMEMFLNSSPRNFEEAIEESEAENGLKISCVLTDTFLWFACDLAEIRGVPWVAFWTAASCSLSAHMYTDEIRGAVGSTENAEQALSFIPGLPNVNFTDLPSEIFHSKNPSPLAITIYKMVEKLCKSTTVVLNSFEEIDPSITNDLKSKFNHFLNIGPSILISSPAQEIDQTGCLSWLDNQTRPGSVIYISFGTVISPPENELVALAEALEISKYPFLWSLKEHAMKLLPGGFFERTSGFGKIVSWAPQLQVLAHKSVGVFVTHCGWNSVLESISNGVPMICRPFFGDQKLNGKMVEDVWKVGVRIKGGVFAKSETIASLHRVMSSEAGEEIRENVEKLKDKAVSAVGLEGSSTKNFEKLLEIIKGT